MKLRLQLHELSDMHSFLVGCIVLNMCAVPNHPSGDIQVNAPGGSSHSVICITQSAYCMVDVLSGSETGWR